MMGGPEFKLMCFCNGIKSGLTHYDDPGFFEELLERIGEIDPDSNDVVFRVMEYATGFGGKDFTNSQDAVAYLFDQVELYNKAVKSLSWSEGHYRLNDNNITTYYIYVWLGEREKK